MFKLRLWYSVPQLCTTCRRSWALDLEVDNLEEDIINGKIPQEILFEVTPPMIRDFFCHKYYGYYKCLIFMPTKSLILVYPVPVKSIQVRIFLERGSPLSRLLSYYLNHLSALFYYIKRLLYLPLKAVLACSLMTF